MLAIGCTSAESPPKTQPAESVVVTPPSTPPEAGAEPESSIPPRKLSEEAWVWVEQRSFSTWCLAGCPAAEVLEDQDSFRAPFAVDLRGPEPPRLLAFGDDDAQRWQQPLGWDPGEGWSRPDAVPCGANVYVGSGTADRAEYRVLAFAAEDGRPRPSSGHQVRTPGPVRDHAVQVACLDDAGVRVFGRFRDAMDTDILYVDELALDLKRRATRELPGALAHHRPARQIGRVRRDATALQYRFKGGEKEPWLIGLGNSGRNPPRPPRSLVLDASEGKTPRWTVDLGPALIIDTEVVEIGDLAVARLHSELVAIDLEQGTIRWRMHSGGTLEEQTRRPGDMGLFGCSRCRDPWFDVRVAGDHLVFTAHGNQAWVDVIDPRTGAVLVRRLWS